MKALLLGIALAAISALPAHAVLFALLLPFHQTSELLVGMVNRCTTPATYKLVVKNAVSGTVLHRKEGTVASGHGAALPWSFSSNQAGDMLHVSVKWECPDPAQPRPLISFTVRDRETKVPQFFGTDQHGT